MLFKKTIVIFFTNLFWNSFVSKFINNVNIKKLMFKE